MKNKKLGFAVIGVGYFGKNYLRILKNLEQVELVGIASKTKESLEAAKEFVSPNTVLDTDAMALIKNPKVECVIIATPPATHFELAKTAVEHGKHVLLEKPMVMNIEEGKKLREIVKKGKSVFMVGHQYVYNDYIRYIKEELRKNTIGKLRYVVAEHLYLGQLHHDIGCLLDAGTHQLSVLQYIFEPKKIIDASGSSTVNDKNIDEFTTVNVRFENGAITNNEIVANLVLAWHAPKKARKFAFIGENGMILFDDTADDKIKIYPKQDIGDYRDKNNGNILEKIRNMQPIQPVVPKINAREPLMNELEHFIECVHSHRKPLTGIESSYQITEWLDEIDRKLKKHVLA